MGPGAAIDLSCIPVHLLESLELGSNDTQLYTYPVYLGMLGCCTCQLLITIRELGCKTLVRLVGESTAIASLCFRSC